MKDCWPNKYTHTHTHTHTHVCVCVCVCLWVCVIQLYTLDDRWIGILASFKLNLKASAAEFKKWNAMKRYLFEQPKIGLRVVTCSLTSRDG